MAKLKTKKQFVRALETRADDLTNKNYHSEASLYGEIAALVNSTDFGEVISDEAARILNFILGKSWD